VGTVVGAPFPLGETVVLLRPGPPVVDGMGQEHPGPDVEVPVAGCAVWPRTSSEQDQAQSQVIVGITLFVPPGTQVDAHDRVRVRGVVYQVDGEPGLYRSPLTGHASGIEVALRRVTG
jgi:hypothetical protein